jgi:hypothetical protein
MSKKCRVQSGRLFLLFILMAMAIACSQDATFNKAYAAVDRGSGPGRLIAELLRIDQEYPDRFALKHEIGMFYLQNADPASAGPYLKRALALAGSRMSASQKATTFGGLAIVSYASRDYLQAERDGRTALAVKTDDAAPFGFITGRALLAQGRQKEALELLDAAWSKAKTSMSMEDYRAYARALETAGRSADVVSVLDAYESTFPYEPGLGLIQSAAWEKLGDLDAAVFCAFKEAEYGAAYGASKASDIRKNLLALEKKLDDRSFNPSNKGKSALAAVSAFARGDWAASERLLEKRGGAGNFERYLLISARIESGHPTAADMDAFAALMPSLRSLPPYFYRLYLGFKALSRESSEHLADLLESAINLAPRAGPAAGYRGEYAVALGLAPSDGPRLLTRAELSSSAEKAAATGETTLLEPLVGTLELKDNRSTLMAVGILRAFAKDARHRAWFVDKAKGSNGRTRERLAYILSH